MFGPNFKDEITGFAGHKRKEENTGAGSDL